MSTTTQETASTTTGTSPRTRTRRSPLRFLRDEPVTVLAAAVLLFVLAITIWPSFFAPFDPLETDPMRSLTPPSWPNVLGTDNTGRDVLSRMIYGASASMPAAILATALSIVLGVTLGVVAASFGGWVDAAIMRLFDAVLAIPGLLIIFAFLAVLGNGVTTIAIAIGIAGCVSFGRLMRAEVYRVRALTYVEAARAGGVSPWTITWRHVVPGASRPLIALSALDLGIALLTIGAIGYLGFGTQPPAPEWGAMIADGQQYLTTAWWLSVVPGITFMVIVLSANQISRYFERASRR